MLVRRESAPHLADSVHAHRVPGPAQLVERADRVPARSVRLPGRRLDRGQVPEDHRALLLLGRLQPVKDAEESGPSLRQMPGLQLRVPLERGKPDPSFFERVAEVVPAEPGEMLYVGDRVDNDIRPAVAAGMHTALVRRGPWATIQWNTQEAEKLPTFRVESLLELSGAIRQFNAQAH